MNHTAEGTLLEWLDGRLSPAERPQVERHVASCAACTTELERLRLLSATFGGAVELLDPPAPTRAAYAAVLRRRARWWGADTRRALERAAILVLAVAGIASATLPGSPLRAWLEDRFGSGGEVTAPVARAPSTPPAPDNRPVAEAEIASAGVAILPAGDSVRIVLTNADPALRIRVRLAEGEIVDVRATGAAADAQFRTGPGRISITDAGTGEIQIALPHTVARATVLVGTKPYLIKEGHQVRVLAPAADTAGAEFIFTAQP
jgi:anti-sigma factor RsiW